MSFSSDVKEELCKPEVKGRHCQLAELAALVSFLGADRDGVFCVHTENVHVAKRCYMLIKQAFGIAADVKKISSGADTKRGAYEVTASEKDVKKILEGVKFTDAAFTSMPISAILLQKECCRRSFLRGAFVSAGSMSDPEKSYHFEIVCGTMEQALQIQDVLAGFSVQAGIVRRKKRLVAYVKEGNDIIDILNLMGAHSSLMNMENVRILKDMRNRVNRRVNCETANLSKTVGAAARQIKDIEYLEKNGLLLTLSPALVQAASLRKKYPDASLTELGEMSDPPVGRSGMNHRLAKLSGLAQKAREKQE